MQRGWCCAVVLGNEATNVEWVSVWYFPSRSSMGREERLRRVNATGDHVAA